MPPPTNTFCDFSRRLSITFNLVDIFDPPTMLLRDVLSFKAYSIFVTSSEKSMPAQTISDFLIAPNVEADFL